MAAYVGARRKLVLAFDIGTTFSGISYDRWYAMIFEAFSLF